MPALADAAAKTCFWLGLLVCTFLALTPSPPDGITQISDVVQHLGAFVLLTALLIVAHCRRSPWGAAIAMLAYGVAIELVQSGIAARTAEVGDLVTDAAGIALGLPAGRAAMHGLCRLGWLDPL